MSVKITELPFLNTLDDNDVLAGVDTSADTTSKVTVGTLKEYIDSNTTYTAGTNIDITNNVVSAPNVYTKSEVNGLLPTKVSDLTNDSGFITKAVNDLTNYYTSSNTYTKTEVNNLISQVNQFNVEIVQTLPSSNIDPHTIYFVAKTGSTGDVYDEYIYINNNWELIGSTDIDLTGYVKNTDYASSSTGGVIKTRSDFGTTMTSGFLGAESKDYAGYNSSDPKLIIGKGTLENVIAGKELTNADDLEELADDLSEDINYVGREVDSLSTVYNALPYASDDGTSITLNDTVETKFKKFDLKGNTSQTGTPTPSSPIDVDVVSGNNEIEIRGKNLLDTMKEEVVKNGVTFTPNEDGSIKVKGTSTAGININILDLLHVPILEAGTYTRSVKTVGTITKNNNYVFLTGRNSNNDNIMGDLTISENSTMSKTTTLDSTNTMSNIGFYLSGSGSVFDCTLYIQLEKNSTATDYIPYDKNEYNVDLPIKNLIDTPTTNTAITGSGLTYSRSSDGMISVSGTSNRAYDYTMTTSYTFEAGKTYTFSVDATGTTLNYYVLFNSTNGGQLTVSKTTPTVTRTIVESQTLPFKWSLASGQTVDYTVKFQIEEGSKQNSYTPYNITPIELCKIGTYKDYFYRDNGVWYKHEEIAKKVFDGTTTPFNAKHGSIKSDTKGFYQITLPGKLHTSSSGVTDYGKSNYFEFVSGTAQNAFNNNSSGIWWEGGSDYSYVILEQTSLANANTWLTTHNTSIYYVLETPTNTPITYQPLIDQLNELYIAKSKLGQTNISQVNNDLPFILDVEGAKLAGSGGGGGTTDYTDLTNKPSINSVTLSGNKSLSDLGIQPAGNYVTSSSLATVATSGSYSDLSNKPSIPSKTSDLNNDSGFITNTDYATSSVAGVIKPNNWFNVSDGFATCQNATYSQYTSTNNNVFISKGTLENVLSAKNYADGSDIGGLEYDIEHVRDALTARIESLMTLTNAFPVSKDKGEVVALNGTAKSKLKSVTLYGNTTQASSPTPSNPVEVYNVTGSYDFTFVGKNMVQCSVTTETRKSVDITNNGDGTFTLSGTASSSFGVPIATNVFLPAGTYTLSSNVMPSGFYISLDGDNDKMLNPSTLSKTFTLDNDTTFNELATWISSGYTYNNTIAVQLERNDTATDFEPYDYVTYTYYNFDLGDIELCKIGDYQDVIYNTGGTWYKRSKTSAFVFDGDNDWQSSWSSGNYYCYSKSTYTSYIADNTFVSKYFANLTTSDFNAKNKYGIYKDSSNIYIVTNISTLANFKTWLDTNTPTVYFGMNTSNSRAIEDENVIEDLNLLLDSIAQDGSTTIFQDSDNAPVTLEVEAIQSLANVLDRLELLENS